ncbi:hypothetical protein ACOSQ3_032931 [Xanthoceras sorbifolium]
MVAELGAIGVWFVVSQTSGLSSCFVEFFGFIVGVYSRRWWLDLKQSESMVLSGNEMVAVEVVLSGRRWLDLWGLRFVWI